MTREQKIAALAVEHAPKWPVRDENDYQNIEQNRNAENFRSSFKAGILAGIRLRDAELLAMEFDSKQSLADAEKFFTHTLPTPKAIYVIAQQYQHEQFIKAIKGDGYEI